MSTVTQFSAGVTYYGRSICNSDCITHMTVISRTRCTLRVTLGNPDGSNPKVKTLRTYVYSNVEHVRPNGRYSMALTIGADRPVVKPTQPEPQSVVRMKLTRQQMAERSQLIGVAHTSADGNSIRLEDGSCYVWDARFEHWAMTRPGDNTGTQRTLRLIGNALVAQAVRS